jgi:hypothetical protein
VAILIFAAAMGGKAAAQLLRDPGVAGMTDLVMLLGAIVAVVVVLVLRARSREDDDEVVPCPRYGDERRASRPRARWR